MPEKLQGMAQVDHILNDRFAAVKEAKSRGKKIIGYFCSYIPLEILTTLDMVPFRIMGDIEEPITAMENLLPASFCPFIRNCIDGVFKGKYDILDGVVGAHSCDAQEKSIHVWKSRKKYEYYHYLDMPATRHDWGVEMFRRSLDKFKASCEAYVGGEITPEKLKDAIKKHNLQRALVKDLYNLKRQDPPLITGSETTRVMMALASVPLDEGNALLKSVIEEAKASSCKGNTQGKKRILLYGACLDALPLIKLIEDLDAEVVMDDNCMGTRTYFRDVPLTTDPMDGITTRYLGLTCARTFQEAVVGEFKKDKSADLQERFAHLGKFIKKWGVEGVVIQLVRFCDPFGFEVPELKDYLNSLNVPNIYLEMEYTTGSLAPLRTRAQTFLETLL